MKIRFLLNNLIKFSINTQLNKKFFRIISKIILMKIYRDMT